MHNKLIGVYYSANERERDRKSLGGPCLISMSTEKLLLLLAGLIDWTFILFFIFLKAPYPHCFEFAFYFFLF